MQCAAVGKIEIVRKPLIQYRIHGENQTGTLASVHDKPTYYKYRLEILRKRALLLRERIQADTYNEAIEIYSKLADLRAKSFYKFSPASMYKLFQLRNYNKSAIYFEIVMHFIPNKMFKMLLELIRSGKI